MKRETASGNILTRMTTILGALFLMLSLSLALINRTPGASGVEAAGRKLSTEGNSDWWQELQDIVIDEAAPRPMPVPFLEYESMEYESSADEDASN